MCLQGRMPLHEAIAAGQLHMVRYCLSKQNLPELDGQNSVSLPSKVFIFVLKLHAVTPLHVRPCGITNDVTNTMLRLPVM